MAAKTFDCTNSRKYTSALFVFYFNGECGQCIHRNQVTKNGNFRDLPFASISDVLSVRVLFCVRLPKMLLVFVAIFNSSTINLSDQFELEMKKRNRTGINWEQKTKNNQNEYLPTSKYHIYKCMYSINLILSYFKMLLLLSSKTINRFVSLMWCWNIECCYASIYNKKSLVFGTILK